jgi:hypothetical protein
MHQGKATQDGLDTLSRCLAIGVHNHIGMHRFLVRIGETGQILKFASLGLGIEAFRVPLHADGKRTTYIDLDESPDGLSGLGTGVRIGRNRRDNRDLAHHRDIGCNRGDPTNVFQSILTRKSEIFGEGSP